ncbi:MAG TPA: DUF1761 domain-containing protein [Candidatus Saccharimonadales bacterium]
MEVQVNMWAVLLATLSSMAVGSIWYAQGVFGKMWMKLAKVDPKKDGGSVWMPLTTTFIVSFLTAYVLAHVTYLSHVYFDNSFLRDALSTAFWLWLGFTAARFITHDAFEGRPAKLTLLNVTHELVTLLIMGLVLGLMQP